MPALNPNKETSMGKEADASPQPKQAKLDKHADSLLWTNRVPLFWPMRSQAEIV